jgi:predicted ATP-dependent endonuclease of OLD family
MGESIVDEILQNHDLKKKHSVYLHRVQIPNFRVLKNVDITFERDLTPKIFPLGSLNGGGKSTLLQLVFTLLYSCGKASDLSFLENMLHGFSDNSLVAIVDCILLHNISVKLEFTAYSRKIAFAEKEYMILGAEHIDQEEFKLRTRKKMTIVKIDGDGYSFDVCNFTDPLNTTEQKYLVCHLSGLQGVEISVVSTVLDLISKSIFLAAPITQSFRFVDKDTRGMAFKRRSIGQYHHRIEDIRRGLTSFFAYDAVAVDILIKAFIQARDDDFRVAIKNGDYGNSYQEMLKDIEEMLGDKIVNIDQDFEGVAFFKKDADGNTLKLYPEDLSHGELKRLSLFIWLKYNKIENSIVLMDEIEIALHPDWQYQIVRDLETWAPSNQYILATHSYELCPYPRPCQRNLAPDS